MSLKNRILLVDALRGFALLGITLIHFVEHFDMFKDPTAPWLFSSATDTVVSSIVYFLVAGKAYSIFALMFGFSFYIQMYRNEERGIDFRPRFIWRLCILFVMGILYSLIYRGDILHIYAAVGLILILFYKWDQKILIAIAVLLCIQIPLLYQVFGAFTQPDYQAIQWPGYMSYQEINEAYLYGSFSEVVQFNIWKARYLVWTWTYEGGRFFQLIALFILGMLLGRNRFFETAVDNQIKLLRYSIIAAILMGLFYFSNYLIDTFEITDLQKQLLTKTIGTYNNLAATAFIVSAFSYLYSKKSDWFCFENLALFGRMSLTNYVSQGVLGVLLFYGFGLSLHIHFGATLSVLAGILFFLLQLLFTRYWLKTHRYGPLEGVWRKLTYIDQKNN